MYVRFFRVSHPNKALAAEVTELENASAGWINGHYYLSYRAQDASWKTLDYDTVLQSWWVNDIATQQWAYWEPTVGKPFLYFGPMRYGSSVAQAFVPGGVPGFQYSVRWCQRLDVLLAQSVGTVLAVLYATPVQSA